MPFDTCKQICPVILNSHRHSCVQRKLNIETLEFAQSKICSKTTKAKGANIIQERIFPVNRLCTVYNDHKCYIDPFNQYIPTQS